MSLRTCLYVYVRICGRMYMRVHACARGARAYACECVSVRACKGVRIGCA